jgi:DNA-binding NarL/FixJ family response regulator
VAIRVLIADDQELVRTGFRLILDGEPDIEVVGEAETGEAAMHQAIQLRPDVVLMDIRMPGTDGIEATRRIVGTGPRILILTTFDVDELVYAALRAGASGFLLKDAPADQLLTAIRVVAKGDALIDPAITRRLIGDFAKRPPHRNRPAELAELTDRELEVLRLIARGLSNAEIGHTLFVGEATVKTHVGRILRKLDLRDRVQAVVFAYECGLVAAGSS